MRLFKLTTQGQTQTQKFLVEADNGHQAVEKLSAALLSSSLRIISDPIEVVKINPRLAVWQE